MSDHTPGPWVARGAYIGAGACDLAMMTKPDPNDSEVIAEWGANARLIAAAPELLEVMEQALEEYKECGAISNEILENAERAIEKAKGASHELSQ